MLINKEKTFNNTVMWMINILYLLLYFSLLFFHEWDIEGIISKGSVALNEIRFPHFVIFRKILV